MSDPEPNSSVRQPPIDEASLRRARAREPMAMEQLFEHYFDRVYQYLRRLLRDPADSDDAVQETFLRLGKHLEKLDPTRDPTGWVFRIATNVARDHWRTRRRGARALESSFDVAWETAPAAKEENAQTRLEREESEERIRVALGQLSPADREIILLRSYEEIETEEIASTLDISQEAVRQRHSRAVKRLGKIYAQLDREERLSS